MAMSCITCMRVRKCASQPNLGKKKSCGSATCLHSADQLVAVTNEDIIFSPSRGFLIKTTPQAQSECKLEKKGIFNVFKKKKSSRNREPCLNPACLSDLSLSSCPIRSYLYSPSRGLVVPSQSGSLPSNTSTSSKTSGKRKKNKKGKKKSQPRSASGSSSKSGINQTTAYSRPLSLPNEPDKSSDSSLRGIIKCIILKDPNEEPCPCRKPSYCVCSPTNPVSPSETPKYIPCRHWYPRSAESTPPYIPCSPCYPPSLSATPPNIPCSPCYPHSPPTTPPNIPCSPCYPRSPPTTPPNIPCSPCYPRSPPTTPPNIPCSPCYPPSPPTTPPYIPCSPCYPHSPPTTPPNIPCRPCHPHSPPTTPPNYPCSPYYPRSPPTTPPNIPCSPYYPRSPPTTPPDCPCSSCYHRSPPTTPPNIPCSPCYPRSPPTTPPNYSCSRCYPRSPPTTPPNIPCSPCYPRSPPTTPQYDMAQQSSECKFLLDTLEKIRAKAQNRSRDSYQFDSGSDKSIVYSPTRGFYNPEVASKTKTLMPKCNYTPCRCSNSYCASANSSQNSSSGHTTPSLTCTSRPKLSPIHALLDAVHHEMLESQSMGDMHTSKITSKGILCKCTDRGEKNPNKVTFKDKAVFSSRSEDNETSTDSDIIYRWGCHPFKCVSEEVAKLCCENWEEFMEKARIQKLEFEKRQSEFAETEELEKLGLICAKQYEDMVRQQQKEFMLQQENILQNHQHESVCNQKKIMLQKQQEAFLNQQQKEFEQQQQEEMYWRLQQKLVQEQQRKCLQQLQQQLLQQQYQEQIAEREAQILRGQQEQLIMDHLQEICNPEMCDNCCQVTPMASCLCVPCMCPNYCQDEDCPWMWECTCPEINGRIYCPCPIGCVECSCCCKNPDDRFNYDGIFEPIDRAANYDDLQDAIKSSCCPQGETKICFHPMNTSCKKTKKLVEPDLVNCQHRLRYSSGVAVVNPKGDDNPFPRKAQMLKLTVRKTVESSTVKAVTQFSFASPDMVKNKEFDNQPTQYEAQYDSDEDDAGDYCCRCCCCPCICVCYCSCCNSYPCCCDCYTSCTPDCTCCC